MANLAGIITTGRVQVDCYTHTHTVSVRTHLALHLHGTQRTVARHSVVFVHVSLAAGPPPKNRSHTRPVPAAAAVAVYSPSLQRTVNLHKHRLSRDSSTSGVPRGLSGSVSAAARQPSLAQPGVLISAHTCWCQRCYNTTTTCCVCFTSASDSTSTSLYLPPSLSPTVLRELATTDFKVKDAASLFHSVCASK